jgi:hypothetical protein
MTLHLSTRALAFAALASLAGATALWSGACGGSVPSDQGATSSSTSSSGAGIGGSMGTGAPDCDTTPTTYTEIINACTNAQAVDVSPVLPLLLPDGGLPPLP